MPGSNSIRVETHAYCSRLVRFTPFHLLPNYYRKSKEFFIPIRSNLRYAWLVVFLGSCTVTPEPLTDTDLSQSAEKDRALMFKSENQIIGNLSLEEAIARAVKHNLDHRAKAMEQALALNQLNLALDNE